MLRFRMASNTRGGPWTLRTDERSKRPPAFDQIKRLAKLPWSDREGNQPGAHGRPASESPEEQAATMWTFSLRRRHGVQINTANALSSSPKKSNRTGGFATGWKEVDNVTTKGKITWLGNDGGAVVTSLRQSLNHLLRGRNLDLPPTAPAIAGPRQRSCSLAQSRHACRNKHGRVSPAQRTVSSRRVRAEALEAHPADGVKGGKIESMSLEERHMAMASSASSVRRQQQNGGLGGAMQRLGQQPAVVTPHSPVKPTIPELGSLRLAST